MKKITYIIVVFLLIGIFFMFNKNNNNITLDEVKIKDNKSNVTFAMYKENNEGEYELVTDTEEFPQVPYILDEDKSKCINSDGNIIDNSLKQTIEDSKIFVETDEEAYCYLYFKMGTFEYLFDYTGSEQEFIVPYTGTYKIELWGAQGGDANYYVQYYGGKAAYTSGVIMLNKSNSLFLYVGGQGISHSGVSTDTMYENGRGYNGGGSDFFEANNSNAGSGGGATDIRLINGNWDNESGLKSRIMVAGGGGGADSHYAAGSYSGNGGAGGGLVGYDINTTTSCYQYVTGGTQVNGGAVIKCRNVETMNHLYGQFGIGGYHHSGGGSGYYGGGGGQHTSASGGSSFISGHNGCVAIESSTSSTPRLDSSGNRCANGTTDIECSKHYSGYVFTDTVMIDGAGYSWTTVKGSQVQMPAPDGTLYPLGQGHTGNGYAKITYIR